MKALALIDCQNGFIDGNLGIGYDKFKPVMENIQDELNKDYELVTFTKDWHPENHCSFKPQGGPWPAHCVQNTGDAELYWKIKEWYEKAPATKTRIINKGQNPEVEEYGVDLLSLDREVSDITIVGLCTDYCVSESAIMTKTAHPEVNVTVRLDACGEIAEDTAKAAIEKMKAAGINII